MEAEPIPFTMDTVGWQVLFVLSGLLISYLVYLFVLKYRANKYRRTAIQEIKNFKNSMTDAAFITQCMFLVKQVALQSYGRNKVAALTGEKWISFLDECEKSVDFTTNSELIFIAIYKGELPKTAQFNRTAFSNECVNWISRHAR
jgi:hypothetical protein